MIDRHEEYERMFRAEQNLWWFRTLHERVLAQLRGHFADRPFRLLDAGCGTGGLLARLAEAGYSDAVGFDASPDAVAFARSRGLDVGQGDLRAVDEFRPGERFDALVCDDVFTYFSDAEIVAILGQFRRRLRPGGVFITNNCALAAFYGTHDLAVGGGRRFTKPQLIALAAAAGLRCRYATYWSLSLAPIIFAVRSYQRFLIRLGTIDPATVPSDVALPPAPLNRLFYWLNRQEARYLRQAPFGSSVFHVFTPDDALPHPR